MGPVDIQFAKSPEFSNIWALHIFQCKVFYLYQRAETISEATFFHQIVSQSGHQNPEFSVTVLTIAQLRQDQLTALE